MKIKTNHNIGDEVWFIDFCGYIVKGIIKSIDTKTFSYHTENEIDHTSITHVVYAITPKGEDNIFRNVSESFVSDNEHDLMKPVLQMKKLEMLDHLENYLNEDNKNV